MDRGEAPSGRNVGILMGMLGVLPVFAQFSTQQVYKENRIKIGSAP